MKRLTTLLILVIGFSFCFTSSVFALDTPNVPAEYLTARDYVAEQPSWCASNPTSCKCGLHDAPVYIPVWLYDYQSTPVLEGYNVYVCRSDMCGGKTARVLLSYILRSPYKWLELSLSAPQSSPTNYMSCLSTGFYNISTNTWSSGTGTGRAMPDRRGNWSSTLMLSSLPISYYSTTARDFSGSYGFSTLNANTDYQFSNANWFPLVNSVFPVAGPPELKEFTLEYYTENYEAPKYIQASSDEPCTVDLTSGLAGYYDLICPSVDFNLGDSSVPSLVITNNTFTIYIPDTSSPCTHIKSINYSLYDTTGQFLCSPISNPISSNYQLPQIPLISLIPPEADWGAFDFLKPAINLILGAFNSLLQAINSVLQVVLGWFIPNPDTIRTSVNQIKDLFAEKIPIDAISTGFTNVKNAMLSDVVAKPTNSTATLMGTSVTLVNWDLVDANITLIRNILNAIFYLSLLLVLANLGRKATGQAV